MIMKQGWDHKTENECSFMTQPFFTVGACLISLPQIKRLSAFHRFHPLDKGCNCLCNANEAFHNNNLSVQTVQLSHVHRDLM